MLVGLDRDLQLGADAVRGRNQQGIGVAGGFQIEQGAEPAERRIGARTPGGLGQRLDLFDQRIARIDIDARICVSEPVPALDHDLFQMMAAGYVGFRPCAMARNTRGHILCRQEPVRPRKRPDISGNQAGGWETSELSIPNIITLGRIILVPIIVWAIASSQMEIAFAIFVIAGVSDAIDGFLAKRFNMASELGALLDPLADKALLVSIYVSLGIWGAVPRWIVILVVSRDIMIVAAVIVSWLFGKPIPMKPLMVSKLNTAAQVAFAALVLASLGFGFKPMPYDMILMGFVTVFTLVSVSLYLVEWVRHMSTIEVR
ncbi:putative CDP-diacylglycerol--glycerol-3-phosphate 3-phosphatidyl-transferase 2 [mine drainage metagenome]|uniref:Putative CDP-diacylglycerol--glycerol-3-phosphate 3-phosphatidyl-transferase 2 n=1 Tax=mine drainage metagenome TaxID=410659 RepID=A0A1J5PAY6_9ZZZZ